MAVLNQWGLPRKRWDAGFEKIRYAMGLEVEASVIASHDRAVKAWREGRLPMADPPASPIIMLEGPF